MTCDFPLLRAGVSLTWTPLASVIRKMALESSLDSEATGLSYSAEESGDNSLSKDQEIVGVLSAVACKAKARTKSVKKSS